MNEDREMFLWVEKYRPKTIDECVLPANIRKTFKGILKKKEIPHMILSGSAGGGKTTSLLCIARQLGCDVLFINASDTTGKDIVSNDVRTFASSMSLSGERKVVIFDEADRLTPQAQDALKGFIEEFTKTTSFLFTSNSSYKLIDPLKSRCSVIDFKITKEEKPKLIAELAKRVRYILDTEGVEYDDTALLKFIMKGFPDIRHIIKELQRFYFAYEEITSGILTFGSEAQIEKLVSILQSGKYDEVCSWISENPDEVNMSIYSRLEKKFWKAMTPQSRAQATLVLGEYQYKGAFCDPELNFKCFALNLLIGKPEWTKNCQ